MSFEKISKKIQSFILVGLAFAIATGTIISFIDKIKILIRTDVLYAFLSLILFLLTLLFLILWAIFDYKESEFLQEKLDIKEHEVGINEFIAYSAPILVGILFGALFSFILDINFYDIIIIIIFLISFYGDSIVIKLVSKKLLNDSFNYKKINDIDKKIKYEIFKYYLQRPYYFIRVLITISLLFVSLIIYNIQLISSINKIYYSYLLTIIALLHNEIIVWIWRIKRNKKISMLEKNNI